LQNQREESNHGWATLEREKGPEGLRDEEQGLAVATLEQEQASRGLPSWNRSRAVLDKEQGPGGGRQRRSFVALAPHLEERVAGKGACGRSGSGVVSCDRMHGGSCDSIYPAAINFGKYFAYFGQGAAMEDRKETMSFNV
jgi:hypothetical protein